MAANEEKAQESFGWEDVLGWVMGIALMAPWILSGGQVALSLWLDAAIIFIPMIFLLGIWIALGLFQLVFFSAAQAWGAGRASVAPPPPPRQADIATLRLALRLAEAEELERTGKALRDEYLR